MSDKKALLRKIMEEQNKKAGSVVVGFGTEIAKPLTFLPTASEEFNLITGGGIPRGRITEIFGMQSSGKTSLMEETIGEDMQRDPDAFWLWGETEEPFDIEYASKVHGIDPERLILIEQTEEGGEKMIDLMEPYLRSGAIKGFVVNSVAGLAPKKELEGDMADANIALQARMMSKLMRKWAAIISKRDLYAVFINQLRTNVGQMFGDPNVTTGGRALSFWASLRVGLNKLQLDDKDKKIANDDEIMKVGVRIAKNRCVYDNPYKKGSYFVRYGEGVDKTIEIITRAPEAGIIRASGSWFYYEKEDGELIVAPKAVIDGKVEKNVPLKFQGRGELQQFLKENPWFESQLREELRGAAKRGELVAQSQDEEEMKEIAKLEKLQAEIDKEEETRAKKAAEKAAAKKAEKAKSEKGKQKKAE